MNNPNHNTTPAASSPFAMDILSSALQTHANLDDSPQYPTPLKANMLFPPQTAPSTVISTSIPPCHSDSSQMDVDCDDTEESVMTQPATSAQHQLRRQSHSRWKSKPETEPYPHSSDRGDTVSDAIHNVSSIQPHEIVDLKNNVLIIDMRSLEDYKKAHIAHAINVNLPTLLIKRYRRGAVSNFNLESFITTPQGTDQYHDWIQKRNTPRNSEERLTESCSPTIVVYDDDMTDADKTTNAWTLVGVLEKSLEEGAAATVSRNSVERTNVCWLLGGFDAFQRWDRDETHLGGSQFTRLPETLSNPSQLMGRTGLTAPTPTQSRSACTFNASVAPGANVQRRASLFSLDTSSVRNKPKQTPDHKKLGRSRTTAHPVLEGELRSIHEQPRKSPTNLVPFPSQSHPSLGVEDVPATPATPATEKEYAFVVSEIVPGFLFLGPELSTVDQVKFLHSKSIRRILNMAEECDDDVPGLKETFNYQKIAARDTIEMRHVDEMLRKAVHVINDSKRHHEPIYVHCKAGKSRSVAAILAYLVLGEQWTLKRSYRHVIKARPTVSPNIGFVAELMKLEESVHGKVSNFAGTDWHLVDIGTPPSPDSQRELCKVQQAWSKNTSSQSAIK